MSAPLAGQAVRVVGAGLIGTSLGLALRRAGAEVWLRDPDPVHLSTAVRLGAGQPDEGAAATVAFVAVPPAATAEAVLDELRRDPDVIVSDTASAKARLEVEVKTADPESSTRFVGGHPIAGRERSGPGGARPDLFEGRTWVLTAPRGTPAAERVAALVRACGAVPVQLTALEHDRAVAVTSHLPQLVASALAAALADLPEPARAVVGSGFADMTRIAESDPDLWADIATANAGPVSRALRRLGSTLTELAGALEAGPDPAAVRRLVSAGRSGRRLVPGKHGGPAGSYAVVGVLVRDVPGELARLFAEAGAAGVNIEDLRVDHAPGLPLGVVELAVAPAAAGRLRATLSEHGWSLDD